MLGRGDGALFIIGLGGVRFRSELAAQATATAEEEEEGGCEACEEDRSGDAADDAAHESGCVGVGRGRSGAA